MKLYDEKEAISTIRQAILPDVLDDDTICSLIDAIYDYYEDNGELDLDFDEDEELTDVDEDDPDGEISLIVDSLRDNVKFSSLSDDLLRRVVRAETDYENSLIE